MTLSLDLTKFEAAAKKKVRSHDNCTVLDLDPESVGSTVYPRMIEVRPPGGDGPRQFARWDGGLNLAVNDKVLCKEFDNAVWVVEAMGGDSSGAGLARVSDLWESDFGDVALAADASGNLTLNGTRTLTIPTDLIHAGDTDTLIGFADDQQTYTAGGLVMFRLTKTTQDLVEIGDVAGGGDVDINGNAGQFFLQGSNGFLGLGTTTPPTAMTMHNTTQSGVELRTSNSSVGSFFIGQTANGTPGSETATGNNRLFMRFSGGMFDGSAWTYAQAAIDMYTEQAVTAANQGTRIVFLTTPNNSTTLTEVARIDNAGQLGLGLTPSYQLELSTDNAAKLTTTTWTTTSDRRVKRNVKDFTAGVDYLKALPPSKQFEYNGAAGTKRGERGVGFLAQDLEKVAPTLIKYIGKDLLRGGPGKTRLAQFNPHELIFTLVNAVIELDARLTALEP